MRKLELEHDEDSKMLQRFGIRRTSDLMALEPDDVQEMVSMGACRSWSFVGGACVRARDALGCQHGLRLCALHLVVDARGDRSGVDRRGAPHDEEEAPEIRPSFAAGEAQAGGLRFA